MILKRYITVVTALILLFSLLMSFASGVPGSAGDPVASLSYVQGTFVPNIINYLDNKLISFTSQNEARAAKEFESLIRDVEKNLSIDSEKLRDRVMYNTYMEMLDRGFCLDTGDYSTLTLKAGQRIVLIRGSSFTVLQGSAVIGGREQDRIVNVTAAGEVLTNSTVTRNARYIYAGDGFISIKALSDIKIAVIGSYQIVPEFLPQNTDIAITLKNINVFRGSDVGFELDREPTRLEALILFLRLIGEEEDAVSYTGSHPFVDVPKWGGDVADKYVAYSYAMGYTKGISSTRFGAGNTATLEQYLTFVLRSLGYRDGTDFEWTKSAEFSEKAGILLPFDTERIARRGFYRDHVVYISYYALQARLKNRNITLLDNLVSKGVITRKQATSTISAHTR